MPSNNRIFYAIYAVGIAKESTNVYTAIHGLQSVGITTTFNLERVSEIGQLEIYQNVENVPDIEVTLEKVIDGYIPIYLLATTTGTSQSLSGRQNAKCNLAMSIFGDTQDSASGTPITQCEMSGMYISALNYTFPVDGNFTENVTMVGTSKLWKSSAYSFTGNLFVNTDQPLSLTSGTGGVQRRQNLLYTGANYTILPGGPNNIPGISTSGTNDKIADVYGAHVQRISVATNLGRTPIFELGRRLYYFRYIEFPVEVTCEIEVLDIGGDQISATEAGILGSGLNVNDKQIRIKCEEGLVLDLGLKNKLQSVTWGNAGADGGNATATYSYKNFNSLSVSHPQSPL